MELLFVPLPQIQKPLSKVFFAVFAVVLVSFGNRKKKRAGSCTRQDMHEIHSDTDKFYRCISAFCTKHGSAVFHVKMFHPSLKVF